MKTFNESLKDGFKHITTISDPQQLKQLRTEDILVDEEGIYVFAFGEHHEFSFEVQPISEEGIYRICLYKNRILLTESLVMKSLE